MEKHGHRLPVFLNLAQIRFPVGALASIAHRVSGVLLFLALPALALMLDAALRSEAGFESVRALFAPSWWTAVAAVLVWALAHHVLAGIRHLLMDVGIGSGLAQARASARLTLVLALAVALSFLLWRLS